MTPTSSWPKTILVVACLLMCYADMVTTNKLLSHGLGELNPFMHLAQTWLGPWWVIPKLGGTFFATWLVFRGKTLRRGVIVLVLISLPVINNLLIIAGQH